MVKYLLLLTLVIFSLNSYGQITKNSEIFKSVTIIEGKVAFLKEIPLRKGISKHANYDLMRDWAKANYGKDPFISSIRYDLKNFEIIAKSRVELVLPLDSKGIKETIVMRYRVNSFLFHDKCIFEIMDIVYMYPLKTYNGVELPKTIKAEDFITDEAINNKDKLTELKANTMKSTLFFMNELAKNFEIRFKN